MTIVITGATGNVGRPLVGWLHRHGVSVRAVSRQPERTGLPDGVEVVAGDPRQPESMRSALRGATAIFLNARATGRSAAALLEQAKTFGVRRAVALAASNVDDDHSLQPSRERGDFNAELEQAVMASGLEWVSLRPTIFASNYLALWSGQARTGSVIRGPYAAANVAPIDERDLAAVAGHALTTDALLGCRPVLTGPRSHAVADLVDLIGVAVGRPLTYAEMAPAAARQALLAVGLPEGFIDGYLRTQARASEGPAVVTSTVSDILGRPAITFAEWAADHAGAFTVGDAVPA